MKNWPAFFFHFCAFLLVAPFARAEEIPLGEVKVRDTNDSSEGFHRTEASLDSAAFSQTITAKDLQGRRTSLPEILQEVAGVQIKNYGGLDDFATVSLRGSTSEQVAIFVDGILLNQSAGRGVNLANIPIQQIEKIEIYKGFAPASFGISPIGGVLHILTKKAGRGRNTSFVQSYGSFNTYEGSIFHSQRLSKFTYEAGYTYHHSDGNFSYLNDNGTPSNSTDDEIRERENNAFNRHYLLTKLDYRPWENDDFVFSFHNQFFREDRGIPGLANLTSDVAHLSTTRNDFALKVQKLSRSHVFLESTPFFQFLKEQFADPLGEIGFGSEDNDNETFHYGDQTTLRFLLGKHHSLSLLMRYHGEEFHPKDFAQTPVVAASSRRDHVSLGVEDEMVLWDEKLTLNPSLREEFVWNSIAASAGIGSSDAGFNDAFQNLFSGKLGIKYVPFPETLVLKTNVARTYRLPNFSELFGDRGDLLGNPSLKSESSWNWDIGFAWNHKPFFMEVSYYLNHQNNLIQFLQTSQLTARAQNLQSARIQGVESFFRLKLGRHVALDESYTLQLAKNTSGLPGLDGKYLPGRPLHTWNQKLTVSNDWGKIFGETYFIGGNFLDTQNILQVRQRFLFNLGISAKFLKHYIASLEAKNLFNNRISDVIGYPLPGRSFYGKLEINL